MPNHDPAVINDDIVIDGKGHHNQDSRVAFTSFPDVQGIVFEQAFHHIGRIRNILPVRGIDPDRGKIVLDGLPIAYELHDIPKASRISASDLFPVD